MRQRSGIALVSSLAILAVVAALGLGTVFLADMNLRIAENTRTQAIARFNAEAGLDTALVLLARHFRLNETLPESQEVFNTAFPGFGDGERFALADEGYTYAVADEQARLRVIGIGPRNARYEAEALVEGVYTPTETPVDGSLFGEGWVTAGDIGVSGSGTYDINFWAGGSVDLTAGTIVDGKYGRAVGSCRAKNGFCESGTEPPNVESPDFDALRAQVAEANGFSTDPIDLSSCTPAEGYFSASNRTVCVPSGETLWITGSVENLVVIGDETTTVVLQANTGRSSDSDVNGVTIVSGTVDLDTSSNLYGANTIIAVSDIGFGKNVVSHDQVARTFIVTEGDFSLNGAGVSDVYASFWVGGDWNMSGTGTEFVGTVVANGTITKSGAGSFSSIRNPDALDNEYIPGTSSHTHSGAGVRLVARR